MGPTNRNIAADLTALRERLYERHRSGEGGFSIAQALTEFFDRTLMELFAQVPIDETQGIGLAATGSFGRAEMSPFSDVDLLFVHDPPNPAGLEKCANAVLYPLWDSGLEVGHAARTIDQCLEMAGRDSTILTSLLDVRPIAGSPVISKLRSRLREWIEATRPSPVLPRKTESFDGYPDTSVRVLEPDLKSSPGGLRDYHLALWGAQIALKTCTLGELAGTGVITSSRRVEVRSAMDFLLRIRHDLHFLKGRCLDRIAVEDQVEMARRLGYEGAPDPELAAAFLLDYHQAADVILRFAGQVIERARRRMEPAEPTNVFDLGDGVLLADGELMMAETNEQPDAATALRAALKAGETGHGFSERLTRKIQKLARRLDERVAEDPAIQGLFRGLLGTPNAYTGLRGLHDGSFLEVLIPEFGRITGFLPYDLYHRFTVDEHSLLAVYFLEALADDPALQSSHAAGMYRRQSRIDLLKLALLCHDVGRAGGPGHAERSARMVPLICHRLGFGDDEAAWVRRLVQHHQLLSHLAQLRDMDDPKVVAELCTAVQDPATLEALFLITYADISAVGPGLWTAWRADTLFELYFRARRKLMRQDASNPEEDSAQIKQRVQALLDNEREMGALEQYFAHAPRTAVLHAAPERIGLHVKVLAGLDGKRLEAGFLERAGGIYDIVVATADRPGLFSLISCTLASLNLNILSAYTLAMNEGMAIDHFMVEPASSGMKVTDATIKDFKTTLERLIADEMTVEEVIASRKRVFGVNKDARAKSVIVPHVDIINDASDAHTVIEVMAADRLGLLFDLTRVIWVEGLNILLARVVTEAHRVIDAFYVDLPGGGKLKAPNRIEQLRRRLLEAAAPKTPESS